MKTFVLFLFIAVSISASIAQPYQSYFGDTFTRWYVFWEPWDYWSTVVLENLNNETTVINEKEYRNVSTCGCDNDLFCYLREEKETGKLFLYSKYANNGEEFVISDMSLEEGDTVRFVKEISNICSGFNYDLYEDEIGNFTIVDSVYYKDNKKHIQLETVIDEAYDPWHLAFIEGIGPNFGFLYIEYEGIFVQSLTCFETETMFWKNTDFWEARWYCYYTMPNLASDCIINSGATIHPNKTIGFSIEKQNGSITVHFEKPVTGGIRMVDAQGKIIYSLSVSNAEKVSIPTTTISHGIYLLNVVDKNANRTGNEKIRL